jgi:hypothetical protein
MACVGNPQTDFAEKLRPVQYQLITGARELLEKTLMGSIKVLTDVLAAANPKAFGRSMRIAHYVRHMLTKLTVPMRA